MVHTSNDEILDVRNSLTLANEITKCGVEKWCNSSIAGWIENAVKWVDNL